MAMLLSILIPTIQSRTVLFTQLHRLLGDQITTHALHGQVEILWLADDGSLAVGRKRNALLERARGKFVAFVDDDDLVSPDYLSLICQTIRDHPKIDCIGIKGIITFAGKHPRQFVHSLRYDRYFTRRGTYFRPPYHLNPIRRDIARRYRFEEIDYSEDIDWAMRICRDGALKREEFIDSVLYYYRSRRCWLWQILLDLTEPLRHPLGIQMSNRISIRRWWRSKISQRSPDAAAQGA